MRQRTKKSMIALLSSLSIICMTGCLETPDTESVVNKEGRSTLVKDNSIEDDGTMVRSRVNAPERITENLDCNIEIYADVVVPDVSAIPIWSVRMVDLDEPMAEKLVNSFFDEGTIRKAPEYELHENTLKWIYSYEDYEILLEDGRKRMNQGDSDLNMNAETYESIVKDNMEEYAALMAIASNESELKLSVPYTFRDETGISLTFMTNDEGEEQVEVREGPIIYHTLDLTGIHEGRQYDFGIKKDAWNGAVGFSTHGTEKITLVGNAYLLENVYSDWIPPGAQNQCRYSYEEAVALCDAYLEQAGIENMSARYWKEIKYTTAYDWRVEAGEVAGYGIYYYRTYGQIGDNYVGSKQDKVLEDCLLVPARGPLDNFESLYYNEINTELTYQGYRNDGINSISVEDYLEEIESGADSEEAEIAEMPVLKECIVFTVNNNGVASMQYFNPMENEKLMADNVALLSFDKVYESASNYLEVIAGDIGITDASQPVTIERIELNLARVQDPMAENSYTMLPVWDFRIGTTGDTLVTVNAIDGSIIDRTRGY